MTQTLDIARRVAPIADPTFADLAVERTGITFMNPGRDRVHVEVVVRNTGSRVSEPALMRIESAPFGAFLPWRPLRSAVVPPIRPGGTHVVALDVPSPSTRPIGSFGSVPPRSLLTALFPEDDPQRVAIPPRRPRPLAPDLFRLLDRRTSHWVGNLNVFLGARSVERHMASALRIRPGMTNLAIFMVGDGPDAYAFHMEGEGIGWEASLHSGRGLRDLRIDGRSQAPIEERNWIRTITTEPFILTIRPPAACREGRLDVHVHQRSTGKEAVVEFTFDAAAAGPGCYVV